MPIESEKLMNKASYKVITKGKQKTLKTEEKLTERYREANERQKHYLRMFYIVF